MIPDYLASLVQLPEKHWPERRWAARSLSGAYSYAPTALEALRRLEVAVQEKEASEGQN